MQAMMTQTSGLSQVNHYCIRGVHPAYILACAAIASAKTVRFALTRSSSKPSPQICEKCTHILTKVPGLCLHMAPARLPFPSRRCAIARRRRVVVTTGNGGGQPPTAVSGTVLGRSGTLYDAVSTVICHAEDGRRCRLFPTCWPASCAPLRCYIAATTGTEK